MRKKQRFIIADETLFLFTQQSMASRYPIPAKTVRTEIIIKRSRFIATIGFAETVDAARTFIQNIRNEMPDANHHVYAFRTGYGSSVNEGLSDDGEPAGTSGKPTMAVIRGADLGDVVIVITRYFGGTKLGTGGLVRAYSNATKEALALLPVTEKIFFVTAQITLSYNQYENVKRLLPNYQTQITEEIFTSHVALTLNVPEDRFDVFSKEIREFTVGNMPPTLQS